jgi:hypothetical protein
MNWIKILNFIDGIFPVEEKSLKLGTLYKLQGEELPFRYIQYSNLKNKNKKTFHFKHHNLKEYIFNDLSRVEREATREEVRVYNLIKEHVNEIANNTTHTYCN